MIHAKLSGKEANFCSRAACRPFPSIAPSFFCALSESSSQSSFEVGSRPFFPSLSAAAAFFPIQFESQLYCPWRRRLRRRASERERRRNKIPGEDRPVLQRLRSSLHGEFAPFTPLSLQDTRLINRIRRRVFNTGPRNAQSHNLSGLRIDESTIVRVFGRRRRRSLLRRGLIDPEFLYQITASQAIKFRSTDSPLLLLLPSA